MTRQIVLRSPSSNRRQPLLGKAGAPGGGGGVRFAEVAGEATAECAAVCCCCPCGLVNLVLLAVYKLPAGLCRRAMLRRKRRQRKVAMSSAAASAGVMLGSCKCGCDDAAAAAGAEEEVVVMKTSDSNLLVADKEALELEREMWDRFYSTGFWRSPSQRDAIW